MVKQTTTFTVNIKGNIDDIMSKVNTVKNGVSNIFSASNLGQSMLGDFNALERILKRIQNTASGPIRSNWGAENLIAEFRKAGLSIDDLQKKLDTLSISDRKEKFKIFDQDTLNKIKTANDYLAKGKKELKELEEIQEKIKKTQEEIDRIRNSEREKLRKQSKRADERKTIAENELNATKKVTLEDFKKRRTDILSLPDGLLTKGKIASSLGLGADFYGAEPPKTKISDAERDALLAKVTDSLTYNKEALNSKQLEALKKQLTDLIQLKNEFVEYQNKSDAFAEASKNAKTAETNFNNIKETLKTLRDSLPGLESNLQKALSTPEFEKFKQIAKEVGIDLNDLSQIKSFEDLQSKIEEVNAAYEKLANRGIADQKNALAQLTDVVLKNKQATEDDIEAQKLQNEQMANVNALTNRIKMFTGFYGILNLVRRTVSSAISTIKELDEQMTKMAVVTSPTISDYWKQLPQYTKRANALGAAIKDVYEADTLYYQQGLKTQQVMEVSNETLKMARIAALDAAEATDRMTAAMRGFNMEINETSAQRVNDVYSQLAAITASDVNEISVAMTKTASIAHSAGMEFETTAAFLSQIIETTRESADTAGTALKTIIARFEELKKNPAEIGEVDGEVVDANKIETALRSVGIALRDTEGQFRDLDDVFLELAQKWDSLDKNTQRYIATISAGSRQQSRFIAMMQNYAHTTELVAKANGSAGASQKQFEKTLDSMKTKLNALKNAWDTFTMGILNSDILKKAVSFGTGIVEILNKIGKAIDSLGSDLLSASVRVGMLIASLKAMGAVGKASLKWISSAAIGQTAAKSGIISTVLRGTVGGIKNINNSLIRGTRDRRMVNAALKNGTDPAAQSASVFMEQDRIAARSRMMEPLTKFKEISTNGQGSFLFFKEGSKAASVFNSTLMKTVGVIGLIVAAYTSIKFAIRNIKGYLEYQNGELISAEEELSNYNKLLEESKNKLDEFKSDKNAFVTLKEDLNGLVVGTDNWKESLKKVNLEVMQLIQKYPALARYVSKTASGELTINEAGFEEIQKEEERNIYLNQRKILNAQERVYNKEASNREADLRREFGDELFSTLNSKSTSDLQSLLLSENYGSLIKSFNSTDGEIHSAVSAIYSNKIQTEKNTEALEAQRAALEDMRPEGTPGDTFIDDYVAQYAGKYAAEAKKDMDKYTQYERSAEFKRIIEFFGGDSDIIKGKADSQALAYAVGLSKGITNFDEAIEKFEDACGKWAARSEMEQVLLQNYGKARAEDEASKESSEAARNERRLKEIPLLYDLLNNPEKVTRKQYESLRREDILNANIDNATKKRLLDTYFPTGVKSSEISKNLKDDYFNKLTEQVKNASYKELMDIVEVTDKSGKLYNVQAARSYALDQVEQMRKSNAVWQKHLHGLDKGNFIAYEDYVRSLEHETNKKDYDSAIGDRVNEGLNFFADSLREGLINLFNERKILSGDIEARLTQMFKQIFLVSGERGVKAFQNNINEVLEDEDLTNDQKKRILDILSAVDTKDLRALEDIRKTLKEQYPDVIWIDKLIDGAEKLAHAIRKVDLNTLAVNIENFFKRVRSAVDKNFSYEFTEEEKNQFIATGAFGDEDFFYSPSLEKWIYKGTEEGFKEGLQEVIKSGYLDKAIGLGELYNKYFADRDISDINLQKLPGTTPFGIPNLSFDLMRDTGAAYTTLLQGIKEGLLDISEESLLYLFKNNKISDIFKLLEELSGAAGNLTTNKQTRENLSSYIAQNEYAGVVGYNLIKNGAVDKANYEGLLRAFSQSEDVDKQRVDQLKDMVDEFNKAVAKGDLNKIEKLTKDINQLSAELGGSVGASNAEKKIRSFFSSAKTGVEKLDEGVVKSKEDIAFLEQALSESGMKVGTLNDKNAQVYADLISAFTEGSYDAYDGILQITTLMYGFTIKDLEEIQNAVTEENKLLANYLEEIGLGWQADGKFNKFSRGFIEGLPGDDGKSKDKKITPWENPYDWLWNITQQINKTLYQRERLERKYKLAVDDTVKSAEDLYDISKKELNNLQEQARLQSLKGQKATEEAKLLLSHYKEYAKYVSMNPLTGQVQVAYEELDKKGWRQEQGSAFEAFVSKLVELGDEIKDSNKNLEDIEDEVKEIRLRGREEMINLQNRVKEALVTERQREIDTIQDVNDAISAQQSELLEAMQEEINETRRIRENTDKQEEIEKKRQRLSYLQRDTSGANQTEILSLQEEIEKDTLSYGDTLIDQSLQQMQKDNEEAAEKRQEQIDIMNTQLARWQESGEIWKSVDDMLTKFFAGDGGSLQNYLQNMENWQALSKLQQEDFDKEFINNGKLAKSFDDGKIASAATDTLTEVKKYSDKLQSTLINADILGNNLLDKGEYLKVTLKDFNPKIDDAVSDISSIKKKMDSFSEWLKNYLSQEEQNNKGSDKDRADWVTSISYGLQMSGKSEADLNRKLVSEGSVKADFRELSLEALIELNRRLINAGWDLSKFATGGLSTKTGPAWLDGTPSKPEYVLNAEQTKGFFSLVNGVAAINNGESKGLGGDNYFNVEINVDELSSDYDVEQVANKVKQIIVEDANYRNVNFVQALI